ncbi:unnamed protein product [Rhodiola kirilowii]
MALASSLNVFLRLPESSNRVNHPCIATLRRIPPPRLVATFARRGNRSTGITSKRKKEPLRRDVENSDGVDPFEALFGMLEEDLKNLDEELLGIDDEDEEDISPEELAKLEKELEAAIGESEELMQLLSLGGEEGGDVIDVGLGGESVDDDGEDVELELTDWQLKKLAVAAKAGKRRTDIKSLAAELGLDRDIVLELLRIPPEVLLSMSVNSSSSSQNQKSPVVLEAEYEVLEDAPDEASKTEAKSEDVTQSRRSSQTSHKKVQN